MLSREQAEHLLYAYVRMENIDGDKNARQSLREVILDAMCWKEYISAPSLTQPPSFGNWLRSNEIKTCEL